VTIEDLCGHIRQHFGFVQTTEQENALQTFSRFMFDREKHTLMILRGCAGTGKTSLAGAFVRTMIKLGQKVVLMAPTGRAAKVFSLNSGSPASTIHRKIYRQKGIIGGFALDINLHKNTLFIVDEASMIANDGMMESVFGSGRLLDDMMQYVYEGDNCRLLIIGDKAQLPPVGEEESPALSKDYMRGYGMNVYEADLNEVLRQEQESGILYNATMIRQMITHDELTQMPKVVFKGFADICMVPGNELIESLNSSYSQVGMDETMVVTRSNKRANIYNMGIRNSILGREEQLTMGDLLMIVKNNYFWTAKDSDQASRQIQFLANGDRACVRRVRNIRSMYGFSFADVWLQLPDYDDY
jgi:ATP-dependent exoDNAse (exonuclease V) alpha subunit